MKISLNLNEHAHDGSSEIKGSTLEKLLLAAQKGDAQARDHLVQNYMPLLQNLAKKRGPCEQAELNERILKAKKGFLRAISKYKKSVGPGRFRLFALDYIDQALSSSSGGLLSKLFGK